jgi:hypothetical protein
VSAVSDAADKDLVRFRRLVRSKIRQHVERMHEPPGLTLYVSAGERAGKCAPVRVGAAKDPADVAVRVRRAMIDADCRFAAIGVGLRRSDGRTPSQTFGLVVASREGVVESWQAVFEAGTLGGWEPGVFDVGTSADLMRRSWVEVARRKRLRGLERRLVDVVRRAQQDRGLDADTYAQLFERVNELGEGLEALLGNPLAEMPHEPEARFVSYVEGWLQAREPAEAAADTRKEQS